MAYFGGAWLDVLWSGVACNVMSSRGGVACNVMPCRVVSCCVVSYLFGGGSSGICHLMWWQWQQQHILFVWQHRFLLLVAEVVIGASIVRDSDVSFGCGGSGRGL